MVKRNAKEAGLPDANQRKDVKTLGGARTASAATGQVREPRQRSKEKVLVLASRGITFRQAHPGQRWLGPLQQVFKTIKVVLVQAREPDSERGLTLSCMVLPADRVICCSISYSCYPTAKRTPSWTQSQIAG